MSTTTIMPDASTDPETMSIEQIRQELAAYQPGTAAELVELRRLVAG